MLSLKAIIENTLSLEIDAQRAQTIKPTEQKITQHVLDCYANIFFLKAANPDINDYGIS